MMTTVSLESDVICREHLGIYCSISLVFMGVAYFEWEHYGLALMGAIWLALIEALS